MKLNVQACKPIVILPPKIELNDRNQAIALLNHDKAHSQLNVAPYLLFAVKHMDLCDHC